MSLEKPSFPQAVDGVIDVKQLGDDYIYARVKRWFNAGSGDTVEVYLADHASPHVVTPSDKVFMDVSCDPRRIPDGEYDVYYVATNLAQNQRHMFASSIRRPWNFRSRVFLKRNTIRNTTWICCTTNRLRAKVARRSSPRIPR
jgi:hypothetical protein